MAELADLIRLWRDRTSPASVGLPDGARRASGLRREELAQLAGLSVDYVVRLEQGRARHPSAQVVGALARALGLTGEEIVALHRSAGLGPPARRVDRAVPESVSRLVSRLDGFAVGVFSSDWWLLEWNRRWAASSGGPRESPVIGANASGSRTRWVRCCLTAMYCVFRGTE